MYPCDSSLFAETSNLYKSIVVKEDLNCASLKEIQYYSGIKTSFLTFARQFYSLQNLHGITLLYCKYCNIKVMFYTYIFR